MKTVSDAVKQESGVWSDLKCNIMAWLYGDIDYMILQDEVICHRDKDPALSSDWKVVCTREEFEAEARHQGYVEGFEGHPDDCSFKDEWMPSMGTECERLWSSPDVYHRVKIFGYDGDKAVGKWLDGPEKGTLFSDNQRKFISVNSPDHYNFRPRKSDRERWINDAKNKSKAHMWSDSEFLGAIYDALISGELPVPEGEA